MNHGNYIFFLSSTFKDFQEERDLLHLKIMPAVTTLAAKYGQSADVVDLRWGINTADYDISEKSSRILKLCLDEIDNCRPYYIIFLGDRYGWIPPLDEAKAALDQKGLTESLKDRSITEMEISYELFLKDVDADRVIICMRDSLEGQQLGDEAKYFLSENPEAAVKMSMLKEKLAKDFGDSIIRYRAVWNAEEGRLKGLDNFEKELQDRIIDLLDGQWAELKDKDIYELVQRRTWLEAERAAESAEADEYYDKLTDFAGGTGDIFGFYGKDSYEKRAIMSRAAIDLRAQGKHVFIAFCSSTPEIRNKDQLFEHMEAFININADKNCYFFIDSPDALIPDYALQAYRFPGVSFMGTNNHYFVSEADKYGNMSGVKRHVYFKCELSEDKARTLLERELRAGHKLVDKYVMDSLISKSNGKSAFYIKMLVRRLVMFDRSDLDGCAGDAAINARIIEVTDRLPEGEPELFAHLCELSASRLETLFCERVLGLLNIANAGLRETDLEYIFSTQGWEWNTLYFSELKQYCRLLIEEKAGRYYSLVCKLPESKNSSELFDAFGNALSADTLNDEANYAFYVREGLNFAYKNDDAEKAREIICSLEKRPNAESLFASLSENLIKWSLKVLEHPSISPAVCAAFGKQLVEVASHFAKDDMAMPTYQAMAVQCYNVANEKSPNSEWLKQIKKTAADMFLSLGAHWTNDLPEALPPIYQLRLNCSERLLELGEMTEFEYLKECAAFYPNIMYDLKSDTVYDAMPFVDGTDLLEYEEYIAFLAETMRKLFRMGYRFEAYRYGKDNKAPLLDDFYRLQLLADKDHMIGLGMGNHAGMSLEDICKLIPENKLADFFAYIKDTATELGFREWSGK